jgi:hypothetical protein
VPVRIFFRGLVLFRFPREGDDAGRIVAELITEPPSHTPSGKVPAGQDDHEATIQIVTGENVREKLPRVLRHLARLDITIAPPPSQQPPPPVRAASYNQYVPKISRLAELAGLEPGAEDASYVRNIITVNRGTIRVKDVVQWDDGGYPFFGNPDTPSAGAEVKFMGVPVQGHAANECVVEIPDTDVVDIHSSAHGDLNGRYRSTRKRNQHAQSNTTNIIIQNYEYQRERPVWWALDFQWYFARLGYRPVDLAGGELDAFDTNGRKFDEVLHGQDRESLLPNDIGYPFPYIVSVKANGIAPPLLPGAPATDIESRPVCIPGDE